MFANRRHLLCVASTALICACAGTQQVQEFSCEQKILPTSASLTAQPENGEKSDTLTKREESVLDSVKFRDSLSQTPPVEEKIVLDTAAVEEPVSPSKEEPPRTVDDVDIYVEIPRLARRSLALADSFFQAGELDSASLIVERFFVLNPLWQDWQTGANALNEKIRNIREAKTGVLKVKKINLQNANARRADYEEILALVDSIRILQPGDSLQMFADSILKQAYFRTFEKVKSLRDSAMHLAGEQANFDSAEQMLTELLLRYAGFDDTLQLRRSLLDISSMRVEKAAVPENYWKAHSPQKSLEKGRALVAEKKWTQAKETFQQLKSSPLRGEAVRELDSLYAVFCTEKRQKAAALFAESQRKPQQRTEKLNQAIKSLDACLDFAPEYSNRETVLSNKLFLQKELSR